MAENTVRFYDPSDVSVTITEKNADGANGSMYNLTGFAEGSFISIEKDEDSITPVVGAKGNVAVARSNNRMYTVTLTLDQTSPSCADLDKLEAGFKRFEISVTNKSDAGSSDANAIDETFRASEAMVKKPAGRTYSSEIETREYEIQAFIGEMINSGTGTV